MRTSPTGTANWNSPSSTCPPIRRRPFIPLYRVEDSHYDMITLLWNNDTVGGLGNSMIEREDLGPVTVLTHTEERFLSDPQLLKDICSALLQEGRSRVILNLENVSAVTSLYLGGLISVSSRLREHGGALKLLNLQPAVSALMHLTRLSRIMEIFNDRDMALKSFPT